MAEFLQQLVNGIALGSIYGLIAVGYTIVYGILGLINFAHGEIYMMGTFSAFLAVQFAKSKFGIEMGFGPALVLGMIGAGILGVAIERIAYRPLRAKSAVPAVLLGLVGGGVAFMIVDAVGTQLGLPFANPFALLIDTGGSSSRAVEATTDFEVPSIVSLILWAVLAWGAYRLSRGRLSVRKTTKAATLTALLTALGVSLLLQNLGIQMFGATPKSFPALVEFYPYEVEANTAAGWMLAAAILPAIAVLAWSILRRARNLDRPTAIGIATGVVLACTYALSGLLRGEGTVILANQDLLIFGAMVVSMVVLQLIIYRTKIGKAMRAVAVDQDAARLMGVRLDFTISCAFAIGSSLAAIAGVLYAIRYTKIDPLMGALPGAKAFVAAVLGGIGNIPGAVVGGLIMGVTESMVVGYVSSTLRDAFAFGILILILLVKPTGLMGTNQPEKV
ncbi:MAG: branched-chain amino acid ABC transporter permease [Candidatus Wallbacteria bacterium]|nr:branched-chain amino acid ABC transporter permease [Candidatus Wallbacteria bacterium]